MTSTYDAQDRQSSHGSVTYTYTGHGERRRRIGGANPHTLTYDALGNLLKVDLASDSVVYGVDGRNRRVVRKQGTTVTHRWLYQNGLNLVAELDGSNSLKKRFIYASRGHVPDLMVVRGTTDSVYRLVNDHLGSVRLVVNVASGFVAQSLKYDAWGNVTEDTNPGFTPFGYAGGIYDATTALVRFGARDYEPATGRWTSKDPIGFAGGETSYFSYSLTRPVDIADPSGLAPDAASGSSSGDIVARLQCADRKAREFYEQNGLGGLLAFSDALAIVTPIAAAANVGQSAVTSLTEQAANTAVRVQEHAGAAEGLTMGQRYARAARGAATAGRIRGLAGALRAADTAGNVAGFFFTGFSIGARASFFFDCGCAK